jgi:hypothetical protein
MTANTAFVIALGNASDAQREAVQAIVKAHADDWWHNLPDVWIVGGQSHTYWGDLIKPVLALSQARVLVLELPRDKNQRMFATRGKLPGDALDWLWKTYFGRDRPSETLPRLKKPEPPQSP